MAWGNAGRSLKGFGLVPEVSVCALVVGLRVGRVRVPFIDRLGFVPKCYCVDLVGNQKSRISSFSCSNPRELPRILSFSCSNPRELPKILLFSCSNPRELPRILSFSCSNPSELLRILSFS